MRKKSNEMMGAKGRLLEFLEFKRVKKAEFYKQTGLSNGFLDKNNNISSDNIAIIISNYNDINLNWLIMGEGDMLTSESEHSVSTLGSLHSLFETREAEHKVILGQNSEIIKQNSDIIKQNSEVMRQNAVLLELVVKFLGTDVRLK